MSNARVQPEVLQKIIGHADYSTTANIYIHEDLERLKKAVNLIWRLPTRYQQIAEKSNKIGVFRLFGKDEVTGSNPVNSSKEKPHEH